MATVPYDTQALTSVAAVQYTGANLADIQLINRDAREDSTNEKFVRVPDTRGRKRTCYIGDWVISVATGETLVLPNTSFAALFTASA